MRKPGQFRAGHKVRHRNSPPSSRAETIQSVFWTPRGEIIYLCRGLGRVGPFYSKDYELVKEVQRGKQGGQAASNS